MDYQSTFSNPGVFDALILYPFCLFGYTYVLIQEQKIKLKFVPTSLYLLYMTFDFFFLNIVAYFSIFPHSISIFFS